MTVDSATRGFLDAVRASGGKPLGEQTIDEFRSTVRANSQRLSAPATAVHHVVDRTMGPGGHVGLRIYRPREGGDGPSLPIVVQLHGAGFVAGDLDTHDSMSRYYC